MRTHKGFTLIELLVVIIIIGIASTIVAVKSSHYFLSHKSAEKLAKDIAAHIQLAKMEAIFTMDMLGVRIESNRYLVVKLIDQDNKLKWQSLQDSNPFWTPEALPTNMVIQLKDSETSNQSIPNAPQIMLYPSGEITPFTLLLHEVGSK